MELVKNLIYQQRKPAYLFILILILAGCSKIPFLRTPEPVVVKVCHLIGCGVGLNVTLEGSIPSDFILTAVSSSGEIMEVHCVKGNGIYPKGYFPRDSYPLCVLGGVDFIHYTPAEVTVTINYNGSGVSSRFKPIYETYYPNGPDCEPACQKSTILLELP